MIITEDENCKEEESEENTEQFDRQHEDSYLRIINRDSIFRPPKEVIHLAINGVPINVVRELRYRWPSLPKGGGGLFFPPCRNNLFSHLGYISALDRLDHLQLLARLHVGNVGSV